METPEIRDLEERTHAGETACFGRAPFEGAEEEACVYGVDALIGRNIGQFVLDSVDGGVEGLEVSVLRCISTTEGKCSITPHLTSWL
jgi:hypothetical protein